jgi:hypothetical protein
MMAKVFCSISVVLLVAISYCSAISFWHRANVGVQSIGTHIDHNCRLRENPIQVLPARIPLLPLSPQQKDMIWQFAQMPPEGKATVSDCVHLLQVYSLQTPQTANVEKQIQKLYSVLQDPIVGERILGAPVFNTTPYGLRMAPNAQSRSSESHRGQGLASLAELGLPITWEIKIGGRKHCLNEALEDCIANFYLKQDELPFTAVALSLYLPPEKEWTNRYAERCTFDDLAVEICSRRFRGSCCAGSHLLYAAMILYRVDLQEPILSPPMRVQVRGYLRQALDALVTMQLQDGSWGIDWFASVPGQEDLRETQWSPLDSPRGRLLATSHLTEWILYLPPEFEPPQDVLQRAGIWLLHRLEEAKDNTDDAPLCPYTHAVTVLECLMSVRPVNTYHKCH